MPHPQTILPLLLLATGSWACTRPMPPPAPTTRPTPTVSQLHTALPILTQAATLPPTPGPKGPIYAPLGSCTRAECLFVPVDAPEYPVGTSTLYGYYVQQHEEYFGNQVSPCDNFVITAGGPGLQAAYVALIIEHGNSVNSLNEQGQVIISLDLSLLGETDQQRVRQSRLTDPIALLVLSKPAGGRGAPACYSPVEILHVSE